MKFFSIAVAALLATSAYAVPSPCGEEECPHIVVTVPAATATVVVHPTVFVGPSVVPKSSAPPSSLAPSPSVPPTPPAPCHTCHETVVVQPAPPSTGLPKFVSGADRAVVAKGSVCAIVVAGVMAGLFM